MRQRVKEKKMKRPAVIQATEIAKGLFAAIGFTLLPFAFWISEDWQPKGPECDE